MKESNRAYQASLRSREYVHGHNKQAWLDLFAEQGCIEDPIGVSMLDPDGKGHSTPEQRETFWDNNIANNQVEITIHQSFTVAECECANILTLDTLVTLDGKHYSQQVNGVFTYKVNDENKIIALRGFWEFGEGMASLKEIADK